MKSRRRSESRPTNADEDVRIIVGDDGENFVFIIRRLSLRALNFSLERGRSGRKFHVDDVIYRSMQVF